MLQTSASTKKEEKGRSPGFYKTVLVSEFIKEYLDIQVLRPFTADEILRLNRVLSGVRVQADNGQYKRARKIREITKETCSAVRFVDMPTEVNMIEFYQSKYNVCPEDIQALDVSTEECRKAYWPIEICKILPGQLYPRLLNQEELSVLPGATRSRKERTLNVQEVRLNELYISSKSTCDGVKVGNKVREVTARILPLPDVRPVTYDTKVERWRILNFSHHESTEVEGFCQNLIRFCVEKGMEFEGSPMKSIFSASAEDISLPKNFLLECSQDNLELLFVFLPKDEHRARYLRAWLKYSCERVWGFSSQCLMPNNTMQGDNIYLLDNVSRKINVKMGGRNSYLCKEIFGLNESSTVTMVIGADVSPPKMHDRWSPSVAAVVASMDCGATKYKALLCPQPGRTEIITDLFIPSTTDGGQPGGLIRDLLLDFYQKNGQRRPERIIYYRHDKDGVGDTQFMRLLETEVTSIYEACSSWDDNYHPKVTCVVIQKRHHTRFSPMDTEDGKAQLGTVVESNVCHSRMPDFYLCSAEGNSRPNRHVVLWNDNEFSADELQEITYSLCHVCARCNTSVSLVTPVYYSDLAAARGREYLEGYMADIGSSTSLTIEQARALSYQAVPNLIYFLADETVLVSEFIKKYLNIPVLRPFNADEILKLNEALSGVRVLADNGKHKTKKTIRRLTEETCSKVSLVGEPTTMNMIEYFQSTYNICPADIQALDVTNEGSRLTYLPMEICKILPGQLNPILLDKEELQVLPGATCVSGEERMLNEQEVRLNEFHIGSKPTFNEFGVAVGDKVREVTARILLLPEVRPARFDTKVKSWCILNFSHKESTEVEGFCQNIIRVCVENGMEFKSSPMKRVFTASTNDINLSRNFLLECSKDNLELLFVFLPKDELKPKYLHAWLKYTCDRVLGFASQCLKPCHIMQGDKSDNRDLFYRISRKINVKMGGRNSYLCKEIYGLNESSTVTMVIGADVTHPHTMDSLDPSVAAVVASMDCGATKYKALLCPQPPWTEFITDLFTRTEGGKPGGLIRDLLLAFYQKNGKRKPERILYYRDGVADLMFNELLDTEVASICKACSSLGDNYHPKLTCVVVQKRHHFRYSSTDTKDGKLQLGTLVENDVCHSSIPDFYLCSAKDTEGAMQGRHAKPNRHIVLKNANDFTADQIHEITHNLCHVYAGCDTSVALVTPVYYSHIAATRGREILEGYMADIGSSTSVTVEQARELLDLPPKIADTMFFL